MEVSHTDLTEVTRMVLVDVGTVVVLTTGHTATTWMLAVLSYTTVTGGHMAAAVIILSASVVLYGLLQRAKRQSQVEDSEKDSLLAGLCQSGRHVD